MVLSMARREAEAQLDHPLTPAEPADGGDTLADPFQLDITFVEGLAADTVLLCSTGDTCGSSCPSACTTS
jgi:FxLD family lantipeptide